MNSRDRTASLAGAGVRRATPAGAAERVETFALALPRAALVFGALSLLVWGFANSTFTLNVLASAFLFAGLASAWNVIGGFGGQFSLAHSVFFAVGAYTAADLYLGFGLSPWLGLLPAAGLAALVSVLLSWPVFRLRGPFFAIATMAFTEVALAVAQYAVPLTGGTRGLSIPFRLGFANMIFRDRLSYAWLMLAFAALAVVAGLAVSRSRLGYYLQAVRDNEGAARAAGIDVTRVKLAGMAISAALTGVGGALFLLQVRVAEPAALISLLDFGVKFALLTLIGGLGTVYGPLLGALLIVPLEGWLRAELGGVLPGANLLVLSVLLVLAALFMRRGIVGLGRDLGARALARRGRRR